MPLTGHATPEIYYSEVIKDGEFTPLIDTRNLLSLTFQVIVVDTGGGGLTGAVEFYTKFDDSLAEELITSQPFSAPLALSFVVNFTHNSYPAPATIGMRYYLRCKIRKSADTGTIVITKHSME